MNPVQPKPVPLELAQLRKLMSHQTSPTNLAGVGISVGLLTSILAFCGVGLVGIGVLGWLLFRRSSSSRSLCHALQDNEQHIVNSLCDDNAMGNNGDTSRSVLYRVDLQETSGGGGSASSSRTVVVKKFQNGRGTTDADINGRCQSEVNMLGGIRHDNIINLVGCIRRDSFILLVYDHMENGSLDKWLHCRLAQSERPLDWPTRLAIAIGVAGGLCYMHHRCEKPIVHHNINSTNILLDRELKAKIAGFGFARVSLAGLDQPVSISELTAGNIFGYTAPEYTTEVTEKVDVYSFGVVLLELVTGRVANDADVRDGNGHLATWAQRHCNELMARNGGFSAVVDQEIPDRVRYLKEMAAVFRLGVDCTVKDPRERPPMHKVLDRLRKNGRLGLTCYLA